MARTPDAERQQQSRERKRKDGLVELRVWVTPEDRERIKGWLAGEHSLRRRPTKRRTASYKPQRPAEPAEPVEWLVLTPTGRVSRHTADRLEGLRMMWDPKNEAYVAPWAELTEHEREAIHQVAITENAGFNVVAI